MLLGHGDDGFRYKDIKYDFSSNVYQHADLSALEDYLCGHISDIRHYPEPEPISLEKCIAHSFDIPEQSVLVTNGATDAIYLIANTLQRNGYSYWQQYSPTFSEYGDASCRYGLKNGSGEKEKTVFWICNPNNPDGYVYDCEHVKHLSEMFGMLVIDQSYGYFTTRPIMSPTECVKNRNVIQIHSLTKKYAIPGLRVGVVVACNEIIEKIRVNLQPWSVNSLAIRAALFLLENDFNPIGDVGAYLQEAQRLWSNLKTIEGVEPQPTSTHFMLVGLKSLTASELKERLAKRHHILIRDASNFAGLDDYWFRIAAQSKEENDMLVQAIRECVAE